MSAPEIRGWCPGALRPMASGDGLIVRLKPPLGRLGQDHMRLVADLSARFGNGRLDLTRRANLQIRGVTEDCWPGLIAKLDAAGLLDATEEAERRRNIVVQPFWRDGDETHLVAQALADALSDPAAPDLPGKFGFAVDCGSAPVLNGTPADIRIERGGDGLIVRADGVARGAAVVAEDAAEAALALARWFLETGGAPAGRGRMRAHLARASLPPGFEEMPAALPAAPPLPGPRADGFLAALPFGELSAGTLAALAEVGPVRLTPWRALFIEGADEAPEGLIGDPSDPRLRVVACPGAPNCPQGLGATRPLAALLAPQVPPGRLLHVSGCAKGCAHSAPADLTLVFGPSCLGAVPGGCARDATACPLDEKALLAAPETIRELF